MRVHTNLLPKGVELPYAIKVDNPIATIGIFGDSFAQLAEFKNYPGVNEFHHESSWIYFLSNILNQTPVGVVEEIDIDLDVERKISELQEAKINGKSVNATKE